MRRTLFKTKFKIVANIAFVFLAKSTFAVAADCQEDYRTEENTVFEKIQISDLCFLKISPAQTSGLAYRQYYFFNSGKVLIFNSFGIGDREQTGARTFLFLPVHQSPFFRRIQDQVWAHGSNRHLELRFDTQTSHPLEVRQGELVVDPRISVENNGGLEFKKITATYFDFGFRIGGDPAADPRGSAKLIDPAGKTCRLQNKQFLIYDSEGDYRLKFAANQLKAKLTKLCPRLDLTQLDEIK